MRLLSFLLAICMVSGCSTLGTQPKRTEEVGARNLAKTEIDGVLEEHQRQIFESLRLLSDKLYKRNPRQWKVRSTFVSQEAAMSRIFEQDHRWQLTELENRRSIDALQLAFKEDFQGDRVAALMVGMASMVQRAFDDKTEFFIVDDLDPQKINNAARNIEIAAWKLSSARDASGQLYLMSNEMACNPGDPANLSFEREIGKIIAHLDASSRIVASKNKRVVVRVIQTLASAVFIPI